MEVNEYQNKAMSTCIPSSNNFMYMFSGLTAEVGEVNDKIAKAIRKRWVVIQDNNIVLTSEAPSDFFVGLFKEIGDCLWFVAGMSSTLGVSLDNIAQANLDKLSSRKERGVIDGNGDNR